MVGGSDVKLGSIAGVPFYMSESQFEYWQHTQLIIDWCRVMVGCFLWNGRQAAVFDALATLRRRGEVVVGKASGKTGGCFAFLCRAGFELLLSAGVLASSTSLI